MILEIIAFAAYVLLIIVSFHFMYKAIIKDTGAKTLGLPTLFVISLAAGSVPILIVNIIRSVILLLF